MSTVRETMLIYLLTVHLYTVHDYCTNHVTAV